MIDLSGVMKDNFINIPFTTKNLDRFIVRTSVLHAVKQARSVLAGKMLDAGCGKMPYKKLILDGENVTEYVGLDIATALTYDQAVKPDFTWDGTVMPFMNNTFDSAMATEVLEHCPDPELFLREVSRTLKPGGVFFFTVPFLWNLHEVPHDEYRYTPFSLSRHLKNSGFTDIQIKAMGGWHASMAQMLGLWVRRSRLNGYARKILSVIIKPIMRLLLRMEKTPVAFTEGTMITGLYGTARKET